jgi:hypothetical protein
MVASFSPRERAVNRSTPAADANALATRTWLKNRVRSMPRASQFSDRSPRRCRRSCNSRIKSRGLRAPERAAPSARGFAQKPRRRGAASGPRRGWAPRERHVLSGPKSAGASESALLASHASPGAGGVSGGAGGSAGVVAAGMPSGRLGRRFQSAPLEKLSQPQRSQRKSETASQSAHASMTPR